jgi:hypothetical protein
LARFRNDTGSVLVSGEFGLIPPGEFDAVGYDPEVHGVIPGCVWLDAPVPEVPEATGGEADDGTSDAKAPRKHGKSAEGKETPA